MAFESGKFDESLHPRDRVGRFIETGAIVRIWGGGSGTVVRNVGGGRIEVQRDDGRLVTIHRNYLTVTKSADGGEPARQAPASGTRVTPRDPSTEASPDISPDNRSSRFTARAAAVDVSDQVADKDQGELAARLDEAVTAYHTALMSGTPSEEADRRADLLNVLTEAETAVAGSAEPLAQIEKIRADVEAEPVDKQPLKDVPAEPAGPDIGALFDAAAADAGAQAPVVGVMRGVWEAGHSASARAALAALPGQDKQSMTDLLNALDSDAKQVYTESTTTGGASNEQTGNNGTGALSPAPAQTDQPNQGPGSVLPDARTGGTGSDRVPDGSPSGTDPVGGGLRGESGTVLPSPVERGGAGDTGVDSADTGGGPADRVGPVGAAAVPGVPGGPGDQGSDRGVPGGTGGTDSSPAGAGATDRGVAFERGDPVVYEDPESFVGPRVVAFSHYADNPTQGYIDVPTSPDVLARNPRVSPTQRQQVPLDHIRRPVDPATLTNEQLPALTNLDSQEVGYVSEGGPLSTLENLGLLRRVNDRGTERWEVTSEGRWARDQRAADPTATTSAPGDRFHLEGSFDRIESRRVVATQLADIAKTLPPGEDRNAVDFAANVVNDSTSMQHGGATGQGTQAALLPDSTLAAADTTREQLDARIDAIADLAVAMRDVRVRVPDADGGAGIELHQWLADYASAYRMRREVAADKPGNERRQSVAKRRTRQGAENYIKNLGYEPGVTKKDSHWNGTRRVPIEILFTVEGPDSDGVYDVMREYVPVEETPDASPATTPESGGLDGNDQQFIDLLRDNPTVRAAGQNLLDSWAAWEQSPVGVGLDEVEAANAAFGRALSEQGLGSPRATASANHAFLAEFMPPPADRPKPRASIGWMTEGDRVESEFGTGTATVLTERSATIVLDTGEEIMVQRGTPGFARILPSDTPAPDTAASTSETPSVVTEFVPTADIRVGDRLRVGASDVGEVTDITEGRRGAFQFTVSTAKGDRTLDNPPGASVHRVVDETNAAQPVVESAEVAAVPTDGGQAFKPTGVDDLAPAGERAKLNANMEALRTLRRLQDEGRVATHAEQAILAKWAGWGGLPNVFDEQRGAQYAAEREELQTLLSPAEIREAKRNTLNAHYTDARAVEAIWKAVEDLGFDGGRVLEPGSGSGTFIGFAPDGTKMTGVELDSTTAAISQYLYPNATIRNESFADTNLPDDSFDATVGNVPYGRIQLVDRKHNPDGESIHNHFILKSLALTKPGGIVAVLSSRFTLDSQSSKARLKMAEQADLVGAVRLPTGSHQRTAGTKVIEDLLIFRKREPGAEPQADQSWVTATLQDVDGWNLPISDYFTEHPENVLGTVKGIKGQFGGDILVEGDVDMGTLPTVLAGIVTTAKAEGLTASPRLPEAAAVEFVAAGSHRHEGHIEAAADGKFTQANGGAVEPFTVAKSGAEELRQLIGLRDALQALLTAESNDGDDTPEIANLRADLNNRYDRYYARFGAITRYALNKKGGRNPASAGQRAFRADPMSAIVRALDTYEIGDGTSSRASIFTTRAIAPRELRTVADNPADAVTLSMDTFGEVNLDAIASMLGVDSAQEAKVQLGDLVYEVPPFTEETERALHDQALANKLDGGWLDENPDDQQQTVAPVTGEGTIIPAAEYLSGNVRRKLAVARAAAASDPRFAANVAALEAIQPDELGPDEIDGRLGAAWIDADTIKTFLKEILNDRHNQVQVSHSGGSIWSVVAPSYGNLANEVWGTPDRNAGQLVQALLEQRSITVTRSSYGKTHKDFDATLLAQTKAEEIQERFSEWLWEDPDRARQLQTKYNEKFNAIVLRSYKDSNRQFPGMSEDWANKVHGHVVDAVDRIVNEPTALLAHVVGAGKTAEMVMGAAELRRLGLARKPAIVVPNHMLEQFSREYLEIYPNAKILAAGSEDLRGPGRREFVARAATGDWDAVILTQGAFESIPMSPEQMQAYIDREMAIMRQQLADAEQAAGGKANDRTVKKMEAALIRAEEALKKKLDKDRDIGVSFEQTGIDYLMVDEAHMYSNLRTLSNIQGAGATGSDKATDLHMKMEYLRETSSSGRVATFASGTPIRNTVTQAYVMQQFLRPDLLREAGIFSFDQWAATFGSTVDEMELKPEGTGFRQTTRFAKFRNVPELLRMFHTFADVKLAEDLNLRTPNLKGGKVETVSVPASDALRSYIQNLGDRAEDVRGGTVDPTEDNMLKISTDGRKAALSMSLVGGVHEPGKLENMADRIVDVHARTKDTAYDDSGVNGGLQIVFLDMGTPTGPEGQWNGYDHLKGELIARGMAPESIRYIHEAKNDAQKAELFAAARSGRISVLIGSSEKMGVGTNIQKRAIALHHADAPWRPADVEQRDGRINRHGNRNLDLNIDIEIYRYVTEGSFDAYMWQTLERKAKFINQIMRGSLDVREIEDIGDTAMSYAEVKAIATGNPDLLDMAKVDTLLTKLERLERSHNRTQTNLRSDVESRTLAADVQEHQAESFVAAAEKRVDTAGDKFAMTIDLPDGQYGIDPIENVELVQGDNTFTDRTTAESVLKERVKQVLVTDRWGGSPPRHVATIGGHTVMVQVSTERGTRAVSLTFDGVPGQIAHLTAMEVGRSHLSSRIENRLAKFEALAEANLTQAERNRTEVELMTSRIGSTFGRTDELEAARAKSERLHAKIIRDSKRADGQDIPYDPRIDSDEFDSPLVTSTVAEQGPIEVVPDLATTEVAPVAGPVNAETLSQGDRVEYIASEVSGEKAVGTITEPPRIAGDFVFVKIGDADGNTVSRAFKAGEQVNVVLDQPVVPSEQDSADVAFEAAAAASAQASVAAVDQELDRNPLFGQRIGEPHIMYDFSTAVRVMETLGGPKAGQTVDRLVWRVERRDGIWGVYAPPDQSPSSYSTGSKSDAIKWATDRANGIPEGADDTGHPTTVAQLKDYYANARPENLNVMQRENLRKLARDDTLGLTADGNVAWHQAAGGDWKLLDARTGIELPFVYTTEALAKAVAEDMARLRASESFESINPWVNARHYVQSDWRSPSAESFPEALRRIDAFHRETKSAFAYVA